MHYSTRFCAEHIRTAIQNDHLDGVPVAELHRKYGVARSTVYRWLRRASPCSRSSRPHRQPRRLSASIEERIVAERKARLVGPNTLAFELGIPASTVYKVLRRYGVNRLVPRETLPALRYEAPHPGALVHMDVKKLASLGLCADPRQRLRWHAKDCLHVAEDDYTRVGFWQVLPDETAPTSAAFLERATRWFASIGIRTERLLTDRHPVNRSERMQTTCQMLGIRHVFTRPRRPQTNGKCERLIRTIADATLRHRVYDSRQARTNALDNYLPYYNVRRRHLGIAGSTPFQRLLQCSAGV
jgi:transposase InsO family protein